jgi:hypothetical protein
MPKKEIISVTAAAANPNELLVEITVTACIPE